MCLLRRVRRVVSTGDLLREMPIDLDASPADPLGRLSRASTSARRADPHVDVYRIRVDDRIEFVYRLTRERTSKPYELEVGDIVRLEVLQDEAINRELEVQPDGTVQIPQVGLVMAAERTVTQLQRDLTEKFKKYVREPVVVISPISVNTRLEDLRASVDRRGGTGG